MTPKTLIAALALSLTAGTALAQTVNPGVAQLEAEAGVDSGLYTQAQLIRLIEAQRNNDDHEVRFILANPEGGMAMTGGGLMTATTSVTVIDAGATTGTAIVEFNGVQTELNPGEVQLAQEIGVEPGFYTQAQLIRLQEAQRDNDDDIEREIMMDPQGPLAG